MSRTLETVLADLASARFHAENLEPSEKRDRLLRALGDGLMWTKELMMVEEGKLL